MTTLSATHTPGPWEITVTLEDPARPDSGIFVHTPEVMVAVCDASELLPRVEMEANARLIAAAPELLEALRGLLEYHHRDDYIGLAKQYQDAADAAIAKAEGR